MEMKAAVLYEPNKPLEIETLQLDEPKEGEVLVRIAAAGVCYSDYHIMVGEWTMPLPMVLGHEGAGVVEKVGPGVTRSKPGDHVILNFRPNCGHCHHCVVGRPVLCDGVEAARWVMFDGTVRLHRNGQDIHHMTRTACFAEYAVVPESGAVPVRRDMPLDRACLVGCSVMTGVGAVANTARIEPGSNVVVIGCGGVGLNAVQGAALAGADRIIGVDLLDNKLEYAREFGATDVVKRRQRRRGGAGGGDDRRRCGLRVRGHRQHAHHRAGIRDVPAGRHPGGGRNGARDRRLQGQRALAAAHRAGPSSARGTARRGRGSICRSSRTST